MVDLINIIRIGDSINSIGVERISSSTHSCSDKYYFHVIVNYHSCVALEGSKEYSVKAMVMHNCAMELSLLYDKFSIELMVQNNQNGKIKMLKAISEEYAQILKKTSDNHEMVDYLLFKSENRSDFKVSILKTMWFKLRWYTNVYLIFILTTLPAILFLGMIIYAQ